MLLVDQIDAIMDGRGKTQYLAKPIARLRFAAERETQIAPRVAPRGRGEQKKVSCDSVERNAADGSAQVQ
jgi:hypothetical protein